MPELPEVETVVRSLQPHLPGRRILNAELHKVRPLKNDPAEAEAALRGRTIRGIERRGKFIVLTLAPTGYFLVHLGMTGKLLFNGEITKHTHAILTLDRGTLIFTDARKFGRLEWSEELPESLALLGPEPLLVTREEFSERARQRTGRIKALLLDQRFVRGVGNIYADEALFRAGIHPLAHPNRLSKPRLAKLHTAVQEVLAEAIEQRGSSVANYVDADGRPGSFQQRHRVYQRQGEACVNCGAALKRILVAQRGTHFCAKCQKR